MKLVLPGLAAFAGLLAVYFGLLGALSGWRYAWDQFNDFWIYLVPLATGFGIQVSLYVALRRLVSRTGKSGTVVAASGTSSGIAMVSCCAHYLVNVLPVLGASGLVSLAAQYQVGIFWVGLLFNAAGIAFVASRLLKAGHEHARCLANEVN